MARSQAIQSRCQTGRLTHLASFHSRLVLLVTVAALVTACATAQPRSVLNEVPETVRHARMVVRNQHRHEVEIVVTPGPVEYDIGEVDASSSRAFRLPQLLNELPAKVSIRCRVDGDLYTSPEIVWHAAQIVDLRIQPTLTLTSIRVQP